MVPAELAAWMRALTRKNGLPMNAPIMPEVAAAQTLRSGKEKWVGSVAP